MDGSENKELLWLLDLSLFSSPRSLEDFHLALQGRLVSRVANRMASFKDSISALGLARFSHHWYLPGIILAIDYELM